MGRLTLFRHVGRLRAKQAAETAHDRPLCLLRARPCSGAASAGCSSLPTLATLITHEAYLLRPNDPLLAHLATFKIWLIQHVIGGSIAFWSRRSSSPRPCAGATGGSIYGWGGLYMVSVIVSSILSVWIVLRFELRANPRMGAMGGLWLLTTVFAWLAIRIRDVTYATSCGSAGASA